MKFEKLSENKIRITLTMNDFKDKDIDFHDFMSNPLETQDLFLDMLEQAKEKIGFNTNDYRVKIEALAMVDGDFIVNITRTSNLQNTETSSCIPKKKFKVHRKRSTLKSNEAIYKFDSFDDYCYFIQFLSQNQLSNSYLIAKKVIVYMYKDAYYLVLNEVNSNYKGILKFYSSITEFGTYISHSPLFSSKLQECGKIVIKHNALKTSLKHFTDKVH